VVSDIDNFLLGNSLFKEYNLAQQMTDSVFKGSVYDPEINIKLDQ